MATVVFFIKAPYNNPTAMKKSTWIKELITHRGIGYKTAIAKGNIIEGIEAKE